MQIDKIDSADLSMSIRTGNRVHVINVEPGQRVFALDPELRVAPRSYVRAAIPVFPITDIEEEALDAFWSTNAAAHKLVVTEGKQEGWVGYWVSRADIPHEVSD